MLTYLIVNLWSYTDGLKVSYSLIWDQFLSSCVFLSEHAILSDK